MVMHQADPERRVVKSEADEANSERQCQDRNRKGARQQDEKAVGCGADKDEARKGVTRRHAEQDRERHAQNRCLDTVERRAPHTSNVQEVPHRPERQIGRRQERLWPAVDGRAAADGAERDQIDRHQCPGAQHHNSGDEDGAPQCHRCAAGVRNAHR